MKTLLIPVLVMSLVGESRSQIWTVTDPSGSLPANGSSVLDIISDSNEIVGRCTPADPKTGPRYYFRLRGGHSQPLGLLPGSNLATARAINASGTVVGLSHFGLDQHAPTLWTSANEAVDLSLSLPDYAETLLSVNDSGMVLGRYIVPHPCLLEFRYYTWSARRGARLLPLAPGLDAMEARFITRYGDVVGTAFSADNNPENPVHAVVWKADGRILDLGECRDVLSASDDLKVLATVRSADLALRLTVLQPGQPPRIIPKPAGVRFFKAFAMNNLGYIIAMDPDPIVWIPSTRIWRPLPVPADARRGIQGAQTVTAINNNGVILGGCYREDKRWHPLIWEPSSLTRYGQLIR